MGFVSLMEMVLSRIFDGTGEKRENPTVDTFYRKKGWDWVKRPGNGLFGNRYYKIVEKIKFEMELIFNVKEIKSYTYRKN